jgi:DNA polymerase III subunit delta'
VVRLAGGNFIKAREYLNPDEGSSLYFIKFQELMRMAFMRQVFDLSKWADEMAGLGRDGQKAFFAFALRLIREYFILKYEESCAELYDCRGKGMGRQICALHQ